MEIFELSDYISDELIASIEHKPRFQLISAAEFANRPLPKWIIKGIIPQAELGVIFGEPGCGKSFAALDQSMSIARGLEWNGHRTRQGRVVYLAAEAQGSFSMRLSSYAIHHNIVLNDIDFQVIEDAPSLIREGDAKLIADQIHTYSKTPPSVIYIDTLAKVAAGGDESSSKDMGMLLLQVKLLHDLTGAMIILVHHCGKDPSKGGRGWSGILGALDTEILIENKDNPRLLTITKQKEGSRAEPMSFNVIPVDIGLDDDEDMVTSCAIEFNDFIPLKDQQKEKIGPNEQRILDVFKSMESSYVPIEDLISEAIKGLAHDPQKRDVRRQHVVRAIQTLHNKNKIMVVGDLVSWP